MSPHGEANGERTSGPDDAAPAGRDDGRSEFGAGVPRPTAPAGETGPSRSVRSTTGPVASTHSLPAAATVDGTNATPTIGADYHAAMRSRTASGEFGVTDDRLSFVYEAIGRRPSVDRQSRSSPTRRSVPNAPHAARMATISA